MSKWINKDLFNDFKKERKQDKDKEQTKGMNRLDFVWPTPEKGTVENPKVYEGRFLPDKKGNFYKKFYYHMFQVGDKWKFSLCPKTHSFDSFCPLCAATSKLYQGTKADKNVAYNYKRKEKFVGNFFIINDPRDNERDAENKMNKTVKLYEFPSKVEAKLSEEIMDSKEGYGYLIFDPSDEGHNFILKVFSTKKDQNGKEWPDYSASSFSRTSSSIGSEKEIEKIMSSTYDLEEYIKSLEVDEKEVIEWMKTEMIYDLIKSDVERRNGIINKKEEKVEDDIPDFDDDNQDGSDPFDEQEQNDEKQEQSDDDLLKELEEF